MPTNNGNYTLPPIYKAIPGTTIQSDQHNIPLEDLAVAMNGTFARDGSRPMTGNLAMGGRKVTGLGAATNASDAVRFDQLPAGITGWLLSVSNLALAANQIPYATSATSAAATALTAFGRSVIGAADAPAGRTAMGLGPLASMTPTGTASASTFLRGDGSWQSAVGSSIQVFTASGTWTKPAGIAANTPITVECWGGGGGGGTSSAASGGGGGGAYLCATFLASELAASVSVTVGAGGGSGAAGGNTSFGGHMTARGGGGVAGSSGFGGGGGGGSHLSGSTSGTGTGAAGGEIGGGKGGNGGTGPSDGTPGEPATTIWGGGGGGGGQTGTSQAGGRAVYGGAGGAGGGTGTTIATSIFGGNGGGNNQPGSIPAGGGGRNAPGARGEVRVRVG